MTLQQRAQRLADAPAFQHGVTLVILVAAVLVGLETSKPIVAEYGNLLHLLNAVVVAIFLAEIVVKLVALLPRPGRYFRDPWNVFDFTIVGVCFLPIGSQYATVLRLLRLLRILRLIRALPRLRVLVGAMLKSIPSMGYVGLFLLMHFYLFGVAAVFLFGDNDPMHFGTLPLAVLTLFIVVTGENWSTTLYTQMYGCDRYGYDGFEALCTQPQALPVVAPLFFMVFVVMGTMIILNLVIGVVMNSMQEAQLDLADATEAERSERDPGTGPSVEHELFELRQQALAMANRIDLLSRRAQRETAAPDAAPAAPAAPGAAPVPGPEAAG